MRDIFLSCASEDRSRVGGLICAQERHGDLCLTPSLTHGGADASQGARPARSTPPYGQHHPCDNRAVSSPKAPSLAGVRSATGCAGPGVVSRTLRTDSRSTIVTGTYSSKE